MKNTFDGFILFKEMKMWLINDYHHYDNDDHDDNDHDHERDHDISLKKWGLI